MNKTRPAHDVAAVTEVIGRVAGKIAIMTDDIIVTGGTLIAGAQALRGRRRDRGLCLRHARAHSRTAPSRSSASSQLDARSRSRTPCR